MIANSPLSPTFNSRLHLNKTFAPPSLQTERQRRRTGEKEGILLACSNFISVRSGKGKLLSLFVIGKSILVRKTTSFHGTSEHIILIHNDIRTTHGVFDEIKSSDFETRWQLMTIEHSLIQSTPVIVTPNVFKKNVTISGV